MEKGVLRNFAKLTGKHLCQGLFFNKFAGPKLATLLKKRLWYRYFPVNFVKFLRTSFLQNTSERLLLPNIGPFIAFLISFYVLVGNLLGKYPLATNDILKL